ncbi:MAG: OsmC family protein [Maricaulaceae bacterium]|jgi:putative redox protein
MSSAAKAQEGALVVETGDGLYQNRVSVDGHVFLADEPLEAGGMDTGPDPYDLLAASLGACKSMTMRMYAQRKSWPLTRAQVRVVHAKVFAKDCEDCETDHGSIDEFRVEIELTGDLDDEQRARLIEISERCPVHRTLQGEIKIRTQAV